jgi:hypothetical protein
MDGALAPAKCRGDMAGLAANLNAPVSDFNLRLIAGKLGFHCN